MTRITPLRILMNWRNYVKIVYEAVKGIIPGAEVYVIGGAAEDRLTILSDIDVLIVLPYTPSFEEVIELRTKIMERAEELRLPVYAPIELHIIGKEEIKKYMKKGKIVPVSKL